jgi:hypothetical protein
MVAFRDIGRDGSTVAVGIDWVLMLAGGVEGLAAVRTLNGGTEDGLIW